MIIEWYGNKYIKWTPYIAITLAAVLCGAESRNNIAEFEKQKKDWLGQFLDLSGGVPSRREAA